MSVVVKFSPLSPFLLRKYKGQKVVNKTEAGLSYFMCTNLLGGYKVNEKRLTINLVNKIEIILHVIKIIPLKTSLNVNPMI
jgi:hypothetical protein